jgi:hypothetical protein
MKDRRYLIAGDIIRKGHFTHFRQIFHVVPKSIVGRDLKLNHARFDRCIFDLGRMRLKDMELIAGLLELELEELVTMILRQYRTDKAEKPRQRCGER